MCTHANLVDSDQMENNVHAHVLHLKSFKWCKLNVMSLVHTKISILAYTLLLIVSKTTTIILRIEKS